MIAVIGFGHISFLANGEGILKTMKRNVTIQRIAKEMEKNEAFYNISYDLEGAEISFEMGGNKIIDYAELDKIKKELIEKKFKVEIAVSEYVEGETGYYYSSEDDNAT